MAELLALRNELILCRRLHISPDNVESDSMLVVGSIRLGQSRSWRLTYILRECMEVYTSEFEIIHGVRQKNMVADRIADIAHRHKTHIEVSSLAEMPSEARRTAIADRIGLWNCRN